MKKTGIMGGSFNPIHYGHLEIAERAYRDYMLDEILFIPNHCPPHKDSSEMADAAMRLEMVKLAIEDKGYFTYSDREIKKGGLSFTYQTMSELKEEEPDTEFYFLMGADSLKEFRKWRHSELIAQKCKILAAMRDEMDNEDVQNLAKELSEEYQSEFFLLKIPQMDVSSTKIRQAVRRGEKIDRFVPEKVESYMKQHKLYQNK